jgi:hypothetical protein
MIAESGPVKKTPPPSAAKRGSLFWKRNPVKMGPNPVRAQADRDALVRTALWACDDLSQASGLENRYPNARKRLARHRGEGLKQFCDLIDFLK